MKKNVLLTFAVLAITLCCSQIATGADWVVCNGDDQRDRTFYVTAPYFSVDLQANTEIEAGGAEAFAGWIDLNGVFHFYSVECWHPGEGVFENIGTQNGGGITLRISCGVSGWHSYAKVELWY
jgi:hypothetical protein